RSAPGINVAPASAAGKAAPPLKTSRRFGMTCPPCCGVPLGSEANDRIAARPIFSKRGPRPDQVICHAPWNNTLAPRAHRVHAAGALQKPTVLALADEVIE